MGTAVFRTRRFEKDLDSVPEHIRVKAIFWIGLVEELGLREIRKRPGYHDEPPKGDRVRQRSARLSKAYRLIYQERNGMAEVLLLEVNKHDY